MLINMEAYRVKSEKIYKIGEFIKNYEKEF